MDESAPIINDKSNHDKCMVASNKLQHRGYIIAGKLARYDDIIKQYPPVDYIYAMAYNSEDAPKEVYVNQKWNQGIRIHFVHNYPHGDDPHHFHFGNCIFTRNTNDPESEGIFYQRYVDNNMQFCCGANGDASESLLYVRPY